MFTGKINLGFCENLTLQKNISIDFFCIAKFLNN